MAELDELDRRLRSALGRGGSLTSGWDDDGPDGEGSRWPSSVATRQALVDRIHRRRRRQLGAGLAAAVLVAGAGGVVGLSARDQATPTRTAVGAPHSGPTGVPGDRSGSTAPGTGPAAPGRPFGRPVVGATSGSGQAVPPCVEGRVEGQASGCLGEYGSPQAFAASGLPEGGTLAEADPAAPTQPVARTELSLQVGQTARLTFPISAGWGWTTPSAATDTVGLRATRHQDGITVTVTGLRAGTTTVVAEQVPRTAHRPAITLPTVTPTTATAATRVVPAASLAWSVPVVVGR